MKRLLFVYQQLLYRSRWWLAASVILAVIWTATGAVVAVSWPESFPIFVSKLGKIFRDLLADVEHRSAWSLAVALFRQNVTSSLLILFMGVLLGLLPAVALVVNFFALGFLAAPGLAPGLFPDYHVSLGVFFLAVAPHGIFEIPALLLAAAFGLRLGLGWLLPNALGRRGAVGKANLKDAALIAPVVVILLAIAALIEAFVTSRLLS